MTDQVGEDFVESVIDAMVEGDLGVADAVGSVLDDVQDLPEMVSVEESALEGGDLSCIKCGNEDLQFGVTETEDGEAPTIYCEACDTALVADLEEDDDEEDVELDEADIDLDDPACPVCGEDDTLEGLQVEDADGDEVPMLVCGNCDSGFVPAEE